MISHEYIFKALESVLPSDYKLKLENIQVVDVKNQQTINTINTAVLAFKDAGQLENRDVRTGEYKMERARLWVNVYSDRGEAGVHSGNDYCARFCSSLDRVFNRLFYIEGKTICIVNCKRTGNYKKIGTTKQGINIYSVNYFIEYY